MVVMGYLSPKQAKAIIDDNKMPVLGPFTLVFDEQAAAIHFVKPTPLKPTDQICRFEVMFMDDMGMQVGPTAPVRLEDNHIIAIHFDPSMTETTREFTPGMRYDFVAQLMVVGDPRLCMGVFVTAAVYDMATMSDIIPIKIFYGDLVPAV
jgi:hypothetical protein